MRMARLSRVMPALLTRIDTGPNSLSIEETAAAILNLYNRRAEQQAQDAVAAAQQAAEGLNDGG